MYKYLKNLSRVAIATVGITVGALATPLASPAIASTIPCTDVTILGARGTGEQPNSGPISGFGNSAGLAAQELGAAVSSIDSSITIGYKNIEYPALGAPPTLDAFTYISSSGFDDSVKSGVNSTKIYLDALLDSCPKTQIVMMGFSQGAEVMHEAANLYFDQLHNEYAGNLSKVWLIADPTTWHEGLQDAPGGASYFTESGESVISNGKGLISLMASADWSPRSVGGEFGRYVKDKVVEVCHTNDLICNTSSSGAISMPYAQSVAGQLSLLETNSTHGTEYQLPKGAIHAAAITKNAPEIAKNAGIMRIGDNAPRMTSTWDINPTGCTNITLPLNGTTNVRIDWGDGTSSPVTAANPSHTYSLPYYSPTPVLKTVTIYGTFTGYGSPTSPSAKCITEVTSWGPTGTINLNNAFTNATNLTKVAEIPSGVSTITGMFAGATSFNYPIGNWDVSKVQSFLGVFDGASSFNQPLENWNVSNGKSFNFMFRNATSFNQPLNNWKIQGLRFMSTFENATSFNQPLNNWDVSRANLFDAMFRNAASFNQNISSWAVSGSSTYSSIFDFCPIIKEYKPLRLQQF